MRNSVTGKVETVKYRISKAAFLKDSEHDYVLKVESISKLIFFFTLMSWYYLSSFMQISRRVGLITGLDMATAEDLQVCNYGIGGHYEPHFDYARVRIYYL